MPDETYQGWIYVLVMGAMYLTSLSNAIFVLHQDPVAMRHLIQILYTSHRYVYLHGR